MLTRGALCISDDTHIYLMVRVRRVLKVRVRVSKLDEIEGENYVTQRDVIRELSS